MTLERLAQLLDAFGAAAERWPEAERAAARRLIERSAKARALRRKAAALDRLLAAIPPDTPSPALVAGVLAATPRRRRAPLDADAPSGAQPNRRKR